MKANVLLIFYKYYIYLTYILNNIFYYNTNCFNCIKIHNIIIITYKKKCKENCLRFESTIWNYVLTHCAYFTSLCFYISSKII